MKLTKFIQITVGIAILFIIFNFIGFKNIIDTLVEINLLYLLLFIFTIIGNNILGVVNIYILTSPLKKIPFLTVLRYYFVSWSVGMFLPGKLGDVSLLYYLKQEGMDLGEGLAIFFIDKVLTFIALVLFAMIGFFIFFSQAVAFKLVALCLFILVVSLYLVWSPTVLLLIKKYILRKHAVHFKGFKKTLHHLVVEKSGLLVLNFFITLLKWVIIALGMYLLFKGFGVIVPFLTVLFVYATSMILALIPITFSGLGIRESATIWLFYQVGIDPVITASVSLILLISYYCIAGISLSTFKLK